MSQDPAQLDEQNDAYQQDYRSICREAGGLEAEQMRIILQLIRQFNKLNTK